MLISPKLVKKNSAGKPCSRPASRWTSCEKNGVTDGRYGWALCIMWDLTAISTQVAIRWNPLHRITYLHLLIDLYRRPRCSLSGKPLAALAFRAEIDINVCVPILVVHKSLFCKGDVTITHSLLVE